MRALAFVLVFACGTAAGAADPLAAVRGALDTLRGQATVDASIERSVHFRRKGRPDEIGTVTVRVRAGADGIRVSYPADFLARFEAEMRQTDPEQPRPAHTLVEGFGLASLARMLDAAADLSADLDGATLLAADEAPWQGVPTRRLRLQPATRLSQADSKWVKNRREDWTLWLDGDGMPLALERSHTFQVGILMFTFDVREDTVDTYQRRGDRLLLASRSNRFDGAGLGEEQYHHTETRLLVTPARPS